MENHDELYQQSLDQWANSMRIYILIDQKKIEIYNKDIRNISEDIDLLLGFKSLKIKARDALLEKVKLCVKILQEKGYKV